MIEFPQISTQRKQFLKKATETYYRSLRDSPAVEYLTGRGITGAVAQHFQLGYVAESLEGHDQMRGFLSIPYMTPTGVSAIRFRRIVGEGNKYHQEAGSFTPLFNVRDLHRSEPYIAICEGEIDALTLSGLCSIPAVGVAGVDQWNKNKNIYRRLLQDYDRVYVVMDPDEAGQRIAKSIARAVPDAVNVVLPIDANETYQTFGREFIREALGL